VSVTYTYTIPKPIQDIHAHTNKKTNIRTEKIILRLLHIFS